MQADVIIIGAGQAGLAVSHHLTGKSINHLLLERGVTAERWRHERRASLRLLTPNWQSRLPGYSYAGDDPDGFMSSREVADYLLGYKQSFDAPVLEGVTVEEVTRQEAGFAIRTNRGRFTCRAVVIATGTCDHAHIPAEAAPLTSAGRIYQANAQTYRGPDDLPRGGVMVVGASASGAQIAEELALAGRNVTLAVGGHVRLPRRYRDRDIMEWLDESDFLSAPRDPSMPISRAMAQPSLQLIGRRSGPDLNLTHLQQIGVTLAGRVLGATDTSVVLSGSLDQSVDRAEDRCNRILETIDKHIADHGVVAPVDDAARRKPALTNTLGEGRFDLADHGIGTVLWATGYRRNYSWLRVPVLDTRGELRHAGGVTPCPGLFAIGLPYQQRRNSTFIDGVGADAAELTSSIFDHLNHRPRYAA